MALEIPFKIRPLNPASNLDERYGPFATISQALSQTLGTREKGLTVGILDNGEVVEYWFKSGILDSDLIPKTSSGTGGNFTFTNGLTNNSDVISLGGNITSNVDLTLKTDTTNNVKFNIKDSYNDIFINATGDRGGTGTSNILIGSSFTKLFQNNKAYTKSETTNTTLSLSNYLDVNGNEIGLKLNYDSGTSISSAIFKDAVNFKGIEYENDYSLNFSANSLITKYWVESQNYLTINDIPALDYTLQDATNNGNRTNNSIQITGDNKFDASVDGMTMIYYPLDVFGQIATYKDNVRVGALSIAPTYVDLATSDGSGLSLYVETPIKSGALFTTRVSGNDAILPSDFITKSQHENSTSNFLRKDIDNTLPNDRQEVIINSIYNRGGGDKDVKLSLSGGGIYGETLDTNDGYELVLNPNYVGGTSFDINGQISENYTLDTSGFEVQNQEGLAGSLRLNLDPISTINTVSELVFPFTTDKRFVTTSVNGVFADEFGNITIPTGDSVDLGSGLHKGTDDKINLGLNAATLGTTNEGLLTEDLYLVGDKSINISSSADLFNPLANTSTLALSGDILRLLNTKDAEYTESTQLSINYDGISIVKVNENGTQSFTIATGTESKMLIQDSRNSFGLSYVGDYSDNQITDNNAIPSVLAVKKLISSEGGSVDLGSGLHKGTDGKINLGLDATTLEGILTKPTYVVGGDVLNGEMLGLQIDPDNGGEFVLIKNGNTASIGLTSSANIVFSRSRSTSNQSINFGADLTMKVLDDINSKGLEYPQDYSANFTDHSLVTKKFVLDNAGGSQTLQQVFDAETETFIEATTDKPLYIIANNIEGVSLHSETTGGVAYGDLMISPEIASIGGNFNHPSLSSLSFTEAGIILQDGKGTDAEGIIYKADYSAKGKLKDLWIPDWKSVKDYVAENTGGSLQSVTTGTGNNITTNAIQIEGMDGVTLSEGLKLYRDNSTDTAYVNHLGDGVESFSSSIDFKKDGTISFSTGTDNQASRTLVYFLPTGANTSSDNLVADFKGRVRGNQATQSDEFVTKAQLEAASGGINLQTVTTEGNTTNTDIEITDATKGIIIRASNGKRARITLADDLSLITTEIL